MSTAEPTRHAVLYFPSRETGTLPATGDGWFLARDIPLGIMPLGHGARAPSYKVELEPHDDKVADWLTKFLYIGQFEGRYLERAVEDFVETSASYIGYYGEVFFDITEDANRDPLRLRPLPHGRMLRTPQSYLQLIPKADRQHLGRRRHVAIPRRSIFHLSLPTELGGARRHRRLIRRLGKLSPLGNPLALQGPADKKATKYDFAAHHEACERLEEKALRRWGSVPSKQRPVGPSTEYFYIARRIEFRCAQARLREHIINQLNVLLARLEIPHSVVASGIPTSDDIATILLRLHQGEISFRQALDGVMS